MCKVPRATVVVGMMFLLMGVVAGCAKKAKPVEAPAPPVVQQPTRPSPPPAAARPAPARPETRAVPREQVERRAVSPAPGRAVAARPSEPSVADIFKNVPFDFDKYNIRPDAKEVLDKIGPWINAHSTAKVQIEGHADERGTEKYNLALGERRANSVQEYLATLGVGKDRLSTISYGEERPLSPGRNEEAWAKNRRAQFNVSGR